MAAAAAAVAASSSASSAANHGEPSTPVSAASTQESPNAQSSQSQQQQQSSSNKQRNKPGPLIIPSDISAFQQQQQYKQLSQSLGANTSSSLFQSSHSGQYPNSFYGTAAAAHHIYPLPTLLKSPRLFDQNVARNQQPQYTPPPMLSPFRKGPGLFYNPKHLSNLFVLPSPKQTQPPQFNHSFSYSYLYPHILYNHFAAAIQHHHQQQQHQQQQQKMTFDEDQEVEQYKSANDSEEPSLKKAISDDKYEKVATEDEANTSIKIIEDSLMPLQPVSKPVLQHSKSRLLSQASVHQAAVASSFFPDSGSESEALHAALIDAVDLNTNMQPFINVGKQFQAVLPEKRRASQADADELREDCMWSCDTLERQNNSTQLAHYLDLVCKSSCVYGSSNNLELGLHVLNYYGGDVKSAIKAFLDDAIELPLNHPISNYKYSGM